MMHRLRTWPFRPQRHLWLESRVTDNCWHAQLLSLKIHADENVSKLYRVSWVTGDKPWILYMCPIYKSKNIFISIYNMYGNSYVWIHIGECLSRKQYLKSGVTTFFLFFKPTNVCVWLIIFQKQFHSLYRYICDYVNCW